jgi:hypothetical protein
MSILVTGASGLLGQAIAKSFAGEGAPIRVVGRSTEKLKAIYGSGCPAFAWDPAISAFPREALAGARTIYHLMGEPVGGRWTKAKKDRIVTSRVTAAQKLAHALDGMPCRLVSASSFAIYPGQRGVVYDEKTSATAPSTFIQSTLRAWENAALSAASGASKVTIIRFGMVCAPDGYPKKLARLFRRGLGFIAGDGEQIVHCRYRGCRRHDALGGGTGAWTAPSIGPRRASPVSAMSRIGSRGAWNARSGCGFRTGSSASFWAAARITVSSATISARRARLREAGPSVMPSLRDPRPNEIPASGDPISPAAASTGSSPARGWCR